MPSTNKTHLTNFQSITPPTHHTHAAIDSLCHPGRLREFDAMRGFSILTVIYAHCLGHMDLAGMATVPGEIIETFFMPLFFFISGFFAYKEESRWNVNLYTQYLISKIKMLVICPIVFYGLLFYTRDANPFGWLDGGFKAYWFVIVLFVMSMVYMGMNIICRMIKRPYCISGMIIVSILAFGMLSIHKVPYSSRIWQIFDGANVCWYLPYFTIGLMSRKYNRKFTLLANNGLLFTIILVTYIIGLCLLYSKYGMTYSMRIGLGLMLTYCGIYLVIAAFIRGKKHFETPGRTTDWLCKIGRRTLDIYMLHYFFLPSLMFCHAFLAPRSMLIFQILVAGSLTIIIALICVAIGKFIRLSPILAVWLFGEKRTITYNH